MERLQNQSVKCYPNNKVGAHVNKAISDVLLCCLFSDGNLNFSRLKVLVSQIYRYYSINFKKKRKKKKKKRKKAKKKKEEEEEKSKKQKEKA